MIFCDYRFVGVKDCLVNTYPKEKNLMEKRIGAILLLIEKQDAAQKVNNLLSRHAEIIIARQGLPLPHRQLFLISLMVEGTTDQIGALTGQTGRIEGVHVKSVLSQFKPPLSYAEHQQ